jgi:hypothetical protein
MPTFLNILNILVFLLSRKVYCGERFNSCEAAEAFASGTLPLASPAAISGLQQLLRQRLRCVSIFTFVLVKIVKQAN